MARAKKQQAAEPPAEERKRVPFISEPLDDIHEPKAAPEGEYDLRINKATRGDSSKGTDMITVWIAFEDRELEAPNFAHYLLSWDDSTPEDQIRMRKLEWKRFCACFDLSEDCDEEDMAGQTGTSFVIQEEGTDNVVRNRVRLPKLKE